MLKLGLLRIPQGYLSLQVGNQLETQFHTNFGRRCCVLCDNCRSSHVGEGITKVQTEGARIIMSGKESTWCNTERIQKTFFVRNTSRNADEKGSPKAREEVAAYNPYPLHKAQPGLYILKVCNVFRLFGDI